MRRLSLLAVLVLGLAACGGSGASKSTLKITFGTSGGTMVPNSVTIAPDGVVTRTGSPPARLTSAENAKLSGLVQSSFSKLRSEECPGTFPDESAAFITALGRTVTVRGSCEPEFTKLWGSLGSAVVYHH
jgi:hypothetical protein